jgi:hypothetical protein
VCVSHREKEKRRCWPNNAKHFSFSPCSLCDVPFLPGQFVKLQIMDSAKSNRSLSPVLKFIAINNTSMKILLSALLLLSITVTSQAQKTINRDSFSVKYPEKWIIDTKDEDYDPDALFSIDAPDDENMIMFILFSMALDTADLMNEQVKAFTAELIKTPEITRFDTWGKLKGSGTLLKGKLMGVFKGFVRIFVYGDDHKTMIVVEQCYDKAYETLKKDYDLISSSFQFKGSKK